MFELGLSVRLLPYVNRESWEINERPQSPIVTLQMGLLDWGPVLNWRQHLINVEGRT